MDQLRFGICGLGFMGQTHLARVQAHPRAVVTAICDRNEARRSGRLGGVPGNLDVGAAPDAALENVRAYASPDEVIADPDVDAIIIALPSGLHADVSTAALRGGKHVLCEKPMALRPADCDLMIKSADESGRTLMVGQCIRFWPQYELIARYVAEGRLGRVRYLRLRRVGSPPDWATDNWLMNAARSGGALLDLHLHDVDFAQHFLGVPEQIVARGSIGPSGGIDHIGALWGYPDGCYAQIEGGWVFDLPYPFEMAITVRGDRGTMEWRLADGPQVMFYKGDKEGEPLKVAGDAYANELDYFIDCVVGGRPVSRCLPQSTRTSVVLSWLERRSIEGHKPVNVGDRLRESWSE